MPIDPAVCIVDTNIIAAALITTDDQSPTVRILEAMLDGSLVYLMSGELLEEYATVLRRPKLVKLHKLHDRDTDVLLTELVANSIWRETGESERAPDPNDNHLWALLAAHSESILVTGDQALVGTPPDQHSVISARSLVEMYLSRDR